MKEYKTTDTGPVINRLFVKLMLIVEGGTLFLNDEKTKEFGEALNRISESNIFKTVKLELKRKKGLIRATAKFTGNLKIDEVLQFAWRLEPGDTWELPFVLDERSLKNRIDAARPGYTMKEMKCLFLVTKEGRQQVHCHETPF